ncbi:MAG: hypothetical protein FD129_2220, partial [bacterium]
MIRGDKRLPRNTADLSQLLQKVMIRTTRSSTAIQFPRRRVQTLTFALSAAERALYDGVTEFVRRRVATARGADLPRWHFVAMVLQKEIGSSTRAAKKTLERARADARYRTEWEEIDRLLELAGEAGDSAKLAGLKDVVAKVRDKVIVFTQFRSTLEYLDEHLRQDGHSTVLFHGNLSPSEKESAIDEFRGPARILISTEAGGEGRNLQFCQTVVNWDLPWNPMKVEQRIGRVHRLGQTKDINIINFASEDTVESYVLEILHRKINMFELVIGEMDMILGHFSEESTFEETVFKIWAGSAGTGEARRKFGELGNRLQVARKRYEEVKEMDARIFDGPDAKR